MEQLFFRNVSEYAYYNKISRPTVVKKLEKWELIKYKIWEKEFIVNPIKVAKYFLSQV